MRQSRLLIAASGIGLLAALGGVRAAPEQAARLPPNIDAYVTTHAKLTAAQKSALISGQPVTRQLDADPTKEVGLFGGVWVNAPADRYVALMKDIENFERGGGIRVTRRVREPATIADFAELVFPPDDIAALQRCRVADCAIKLGEPALVRLQKTIDWRKPTAHDDVNVFGRQLASDYVNAYLQGGNARLAVYRDSSKPTFVAEEFRSMIERLPALGEVLPDLPELHEYLLNYPKATLTGATSFIYWQEVEFGLKPTVRISHVVIWPRPGRVVVASKQIYASHYFWTALELRVLVPDPARGPGFWFMNVSRSRSDGLSGFVGSMIRGKVRTEGEKGIRAMLTSVKAKLEKQ